MKINLLNQKNEQTLNSIAGLTDGPNLSPNLYTKAEATENEALVKSKKNFILFSKILIILLLLGYIASILLLQHQVFATHKLAVEVDGKIEGLETYNAESLQIDKVNRRIQVHKDVTKTHKNISNKITAILGEVQTDENLLGFEFKENTFTFDIAREDVLDVSRVLDLVLAKDFVNEIAILEANLNTTENKYIIKLEVSLK
jgi:hypothetical protein